MFLVIILSQSLNTNFQATHPTFAGSTSLIMLSVGIQYMWRMSHTSAPNQKRLAKRLGILILVTSCLGFITIIPFAGYQIRFELYFISWVIAAIGPIFMKKTLENFPTKFEHLTERYSLFTLLLFGESVIAVATSIHVHELHWASLFFFILIVLLFSFYILTYDLGLNRKLENTAGIGLITVHYMIFIGLAFIAAPTELYIGNELSSSCYLTITFVGLVCFFVGIIGMLFYYHKGNFNVRLTVIKATIFALLWSLVSCFVVINVLIEMIWTVVLLTVWLFLWWKNVLGSSTYE
ncbi:low temperature requirement protein A [Pediococcus claussenii]|uniref:low temperature requirement protein A n=1 Tax=Pediococcus claussenii TaxID=187452 RepID=UPI0013052765|nr:low temperature requirement protein A [Pediococcus claussenii]